MVQYNISVGTCKGEFVPFYKNFKSWKRTGQISTKEVLGRQKLPFTWLPGRWYHGYGKLSNTHPLGPCGAQRRAAPFYAFTDRGSGMSNVLEKGRGSVRVRAQWSYDKENNCIDVTRIPPTTTVEAIMDKITELVKLGKIREISDMRDETDLNGLKLTIDLKRGQDPDKLMARLFKATPLEDSFACNFNVLIGGQPKVLGVRDILLEWIAFRAECVRRRTYYDLKGKEKRLHLLQGLKAILLDIDKAIEIVRNTAEESEVVPNLMIGFGIDEVQAEYVAEIKLRHLNREYILKRTEEIEELEDAIADLQDILKRPARINRIIMQELGDVAKKYGKPRRCEILYEIPADTADEPDEQVPDYPVHLFFTRDGYFKKITPQSLRMSGEQKLKDGDEVLFTCESTNSAELLFFTNHHQVYKSHAYDFGDSKASVLGDYVASSLGMEEGEVPLYMVVTPDYKGWMLFFFQNGKCAKVPLSSYETKQNRRLIVEELQSGVLDDYNTSRHGEVMQVLCEGFDEEQGLWYGRTYADSVEVDGHVYFDAADNEPAEGEFVSVLITESLGPDLLGVRQKEA